MFKKISVLITLCYVISFQIPSFAEDIFSTTAPENPSENYTNTQNGLDYTTTSTQNINPVYNSNQYQTYHNPWGTNRYQNYYGYRAYNQAGYPSQVYPQYYNNGMQYPIAKNIGTNVLYSLFNH